MTAPAAATLAALYGAGDRYAAAILDGWIMSGRLTTADVAYLRYRAGGKA